MCLFSSLNDFFASHTESLRYFSRVVWILNVILLLFFIIELHFLRKVKWRKISHAYLMVILSMISSLISSSFFTLSADTICAFGPIIAISLRTMSKSFTWGLYIVRGQMVMEALDSIFLSKFAKKAPYILGIQCIFITTLIVIFTESSSESEESDNKCIVNYPLWLLISSALIGELFYGLGFMYIFYRAMNNSMDNVFKSLRVIDAYKTKKQIRHHMTIYMIQLISSILFLLFVSLCICFQTLVLFEAELFISNLCLLLLFRKKMVLIRKVFANNCCITDEHRMADNLPHFKMSWSSMRNFKFGLNSSYLLSMNWRSEKEVAKRKHELNAHKMPSSANNKAKQIMGVEVVKTIKTATMPLEVPKLPLFVATDSIDVLQSVKISMPSLIDRYNIDDNGNNEEHIPLSAPTTPTTKDNVSDNLASNKEDLFAIHSMSDALNYRLQSISDNAPTDDMKIDSINYNPSLLMNIHNKSESTTVLDQQSNKNDINEVNNNSHHQEQISNSQQLTNVESTSNHNIGDRKSSSFMSKVTSFMDKFTKSNSSPMENNKKTLMAEDFAAATPITKDDEKYVYDIFAMEENMNDARKMDNLCSLTDPIKIEHPKTRRVKHTLSASTPITFL